MTGHTPRTEKAWPTVRPQGRIDRGGEGSLPHASQPRVAEGQQATPVPSTQAADQGQERVLEHLLPYLFYIFFLMLTAAGILLLIRDEPGLGVARPQALLLFVALPLAAVGLFHLGRGRLSGLLFSHVMFVRRVRPGLGARLRILPGVFRLLALTLIAAALLGPYSTLPDKVEVEGIDIVICLDMSNSMEEADLVPDRLTAAKQTIDTLIRRRQTGRLGRGDRIGLVVFGREAYTYAPLTFDYDALRGLIRDLHLGFIDGRGTAIGNALGVALNRLRHSTARSKAIILLTDGDNNSGNISPLQAAQIARTLGVKIYTILMGQNDDTGSFTGNPLVRRYPVNPKLLEQIAAMSGGSPYLATDTQALQTRFHQVLEELERSKLKDASIAKTPLAPYFLWPAFGFLALETLLRLTRFRKFP